MKKKSVPTQSMLLKKWIKIFRSDAKQLTKIAHEVGRLSYEPAYLTGKGGFLLAAKFYLRVAKGYERNLNKLEKRKSR